MKYQLWHSESESSYWLLYEGDTASDHTKEPDSKVIWTCEASTYEEALQSGTTTSGGASTGAMASCSITRQRP